MCVKGALQAGLPQHVHYSIFLIALFRIVSAIKKMALAEFYINGVLHKIQGLYVSIYVEPLKEVSKRHANADHTAVRMDGPSRGWKGGRCLGRCRL